MYMNGGESVSCVCVYRSILFIRGGHRRIRRYICMCMGARVCELVCVLACVCTQTYY